MLIVGLICIFSYVFKTDSFCRRNFNDYCPLIFIFFENPVFLKKWKRRRKRGIIYILINLIIVYAKAILFSVLISIHLSPINLNTVVFLEGSTHKDKLPSVCSQLVSHLDKRILIGHARIGDVTSNWFDK